MAFSTDIRILEAEPYFSYETARSLLKFGGVVMDSALLCHVRVLVENRRGDAAEGWGSILLADQWAWPSDDVPHEKTETVMKRFVIRWCEEVAGDREFAHPLDHFWRRERELENVAREVSLACLVVETMPRMAALVCASPYDAAVHDAFGNAADFDTYHGYGKECMGHDLATWLGPNFRGVYISDFLVPMPRRIDAYHLVGGFDKLTTAEITQDDPHDGLPISLDQWIAIDGLHCLKVKLRGNDLGWDLERMCAVTEVARRELTKRHKSELRLTVDTNEMCDSPEYMVELLLKFKERDSRGFQALQYVEQPCHRDLRQHMHDVRKLATIKPVIVDEALASLDDFTLAVDLGYSGVALKTCKCQSEQLVIAAKANQLGLLCSVQDLANTGIALIHSVGLASRLPTVQAVESNSRQFYPAANAPERKVHPGIFRLRNGQISTDSIYGPGLGYRWAEIDRNLERQTAKELVKGK